MANPIHEWIIKQEADRSMTLEQFCARIKGAVYALRERLTIGYDDDIDIDNLEGEE